MTPKQRVLSTLHHAKTDRPPRGELLIEKEFLRNLYPDEKKIPCNDLLRRLIYEIGLDVVVLRFDGDRREDELGELGEWADENRLFVMALVDGLFWKPEDVLSFNDFILDISREDEKVGDLIHKKKEKALGLIQKCLENGADGIIIGDDLAYDRGPFVSPKALRKWIFPGLSELADAIKKQQKTAFLHSCGDLTTIIDQILDAGFDGLHGLAPSSGNDPLAIYEMTRKKLTLMGSFDLDGLEPEEIEVQKQKLLPVFAADGGYILGSSAGLSINTPIDSFKALYL